MRSKPGGGNQRYRQTTDAKETQGGREILKYPDFHGINRKGDAQTFFPLSFVIC